MWLLTALLACAPTLSPGAHAAPPVEAPTPAETTADDVPPGGSVKDGVIYDAKGLVWGCVGGGNWCSPNPLHGWVEPKLPECHDAVLLTKHKFEDIQRDFCKLCEGKVDVACVLDWPTSDVPSCDLWDELRNSIFAYYGYPFKNTVWREKFKDWYHENPTFDESMMSAEAKYNVQLLKKMKETRQRCQ